LLLSSGDDGLRILSEQRVHEFTLCLAAGQWGGARQIGADGHAALNRGAVADPVEPCLNMAERAEVLAKMPRIADPWIK
jgi:hypothetical protein